MELPRSALSGKAHEHPPENREPTAEADLTVTLPVTVWSDIIGTLWGVAWTEPSSAAGELAGRLYAEYSRALGVDPALAVDMLGLLPDRLRQQARNHA